MDHAEAVAAQAKRDRRERIATMVLAGFCAGPKGHLTSGPMLVDLAMDATDALMRRLDVVRDGD